MRRFYAPKENFTGSHVELNADETRHLRDVLRLRSGDEVSVFDGEGNEYHCSINEIGKRASSLDLIERIAPASPESSLEFTLAATTLNGEKFDLVIQKAVELGVNILVPMNTIRCDVKLKDAEKRMDRWRRIALEATKQSGRARLMHIAEPIGFETFVGHKENDSFILFSERYGEPFSTIKKSKKITALFGPKGGWDDSELAAAGSAGIKVITLGGRILRAETASIAITAILQHRFGDLN